MKSSETVMHVPVLSEIFFTIQLASSFETDMDWDTGVLEGFLRQLMCSEFSYFPSIRSIGGG